MYIVVNRLVEPHLDSGCLTMTRLTVSCQAAASSSLGGAGHTRGAKVCRTCFRRDTSASVRLPPDIRYDH